MPLPHDCFAVTLTGAGSASLVLGGQRWEFVTQGFLHSEVDLRGRNGSIALPVPVKDEPRDGDDDNVHVIPADDGHGTVLPVALSEGPVNLPNGPIDDDIDPNLAAPLHAPPPIVAAAAEDIVMDPIHPATADAPAAASLLAPDVDTVPSHVNHTPTPVDAGPPDARSDGPVDIYTDLVCTLVQHRELVRDYRAQHPQVAWIAPPRALAADLRRHLLGTTKSSDERANLDRLSPAISARLAVHGRIANARQAWMKLQLRYAGDVGTREVIPDGDALYDLLVRIHRGKNGRAHVRPASMRKMINKTYVLGPGEPFYTAWCGMCPGCPYPN
ncbi:unnamed protein product [Peniophora sp. CBMAI 1063]|nr:unnamed protein product [Peniophora sp. CBMAI 1063]